MAFPRFLLSANSLVTNCIEFWRRKIPHQGHFQFPKAATKMKAGIQKLLESSTFCQAYACQFCMLHIWQFGTPHIWLFPNPQVQGFCIVQLECWYIPSAPRILQVFPYRHTPGSPQFLRNTSQPKDVIPGKHLEPCTIAVVFFSSLLWNTHALCVLHSV